MSGETERQPPAPRLPDAMRRLLEDPTPETERLAFVLTTIDANGWPRHAMVSALELAVARSGDLRLLLRSSTRSAGNLVRDGRATLVIAAAGVACYLAARVVAQAPLDAAPDHRAFALRPTAVRSDAPEGVRLLSGITYEGDDAGMNRARRHALRRALCEAELGGG